MALSSLAQADNPKDFPYLADDTLSSKQIAPWLELQRFLSFSFACLSSAPKPL
jgi:hypothetical protein